MPIAARRVFRLSLTMALALAGAYGLALPLPFLAPLFALLLTAAPAPPPGPKGLLGLILLVLITLGVGVLLIPILLNYALTGILLVAIGLYFSTYLTVHRGKALIGTFLTIGFTLISAAGTLDFGLAVTVIKALVLDLPKGEQVDFRAGGYIQIECPPHEVRYADFDIEEEYRPDWDNFDVWRYTSTVGETINRAYSMANYPEEEGIIMLNVRIASPPPRGPERGSSCTSSLRSSRGFSALRANARRLRSRSIAACSNRILDGTGRYLPLLRGGVFGSFLSSGDSLRSKSV